MAEIVLLELGNPRGVGVEVNTKRMVSNSFLANAIDDMVRHMNQFKFGTRAVKFYAFVLSKR